MEAVNVKDFRKSQTCPSSALLLAFHEVALSPEVMTLVKNHLAGCEFCYAESMLLARHAQPPKHSIKAPELPINLRILAESIMSQSKRFKKPARAQHGLRLND